MSDPKLDVPRGHSVDGIEEFDNPLPRWWLWIFYLTTLFGYGYWMHYHVAHTGKGTVATYEAWRAEVQRKQEAAERARPKTDDEQLLALTRDEKTLEAGKAAFVQNCAACHTETGAGNIGPNLTDEYWLHGNKPTQILHTISTGVLEKGMPAWEPVLGSDKVRLLAAYVISREGLNLPGKAPQGEKLGIVK